MKPTMLGLIVSAAAFAGSTVYFWQQLGIERERATQVAAQTEALKQRIAQLEEARETLNPFGPGEPPLAAPKGDHAMSSAPLTSGATSGPTSDSEVTVSGNQFSTRPHEPSAAMRKMMRAQLRSNNKRLYGDLVDQMGLSEEQANKFYDLLTDQQANNFSMRGLDPEEARAKMIQARKQHEAAIDDLLGADKVATYKEYQETMGVRAEVDMIARQLEAMEHSLSADQRKRLVAALIEEQRRVPQPEYSSYGDGEMYNKALADWQVQYNERAADRARGILNTEQFSSYNEYQQWQAEMRENFRTMPGRRTRGGNAMSMTAAPAFIGPVTVPAPAPPPEKE